MAAWLNISNDNGLVLQSVEVDGNGSKGDVWYGMDIVVSGFSICSFGTNTGGRTSSSGGVCGS